MTNYDRQVAERDFVRETAEINAHVLELVQMVETDADKAVNSRNIEELIAILRDAVLLLRAVTEYLVGRQNPNTSLTFVKG